MEKEKLTVGKLIEKLQEFDKDLIIEADGCDCIEDAVGVELNEGKVCIIRNNGCFDQFYRKDEGDNG